MKASSCSFCPQFIQRTVVPGGGFLSGLAFPGIYFSLSAAGLRTCESPVLYRNPPRFLACALSSSISQRASFGLSTVLTCFLS